MIPPRRRSNPFGQSPSWTPHDLTGGVRIGVPGAPPPPALPPFQVQPAQLTPINLAQPRPGTVAGSEQLMKVPPVPQIPKMPSLGPPPATNRMDSYFQSMLGDQIGRAAAAKLGFGTGTAASAQQKQAQSQATWLANYQAAFPDATPEEGIAAYQAAERTKIGKQLPANKQAQSEAAWKATYAQGYPDATPEEIDAAYQAAQKVKVDKQLKTPTAALTPDQIAQKKYADFAALRKSQGASPAQIDAEWSAQNKVPTTPDEIANKKYLDFAALRRNQGATQEQIDSEWSAQNKLPATADETAQKKYAAFAALRRSQGATQAQIDAEWSAQNKMPTTAPPNKANADKIANPQNYYRHSRDGVVEYLTDPNTTIWPDVSVADAQQIYDFAIKMDPTGGKGNAANPKFWDWIALQVQSLHGDSSVQQPTKAIGGAPAVSVTQTIGPPVSGSPLSQPVKAPSVTSADNAVQVPWPTIEQYKAEITDQSGGFLPRTTVPEPQIGVNPDEQGAWFTAMRDAGYTGPMLPSDATAADYQKAQDQAIADARLAARPGWFNDLPEPTSTASFTATSPTAGVTGVTAAIPPALRDAVSQAYQNVQAVIGAVPGQVPQNPIAQAAAQGVSAGVEGAIGGPLTILQKSLDQLRQGSGDPSILGVKPFDVAQGGINIASGAFLTPVIQRSLAQQFIGLGIVPSTPELQRISKTPASLVNQDSAVLDQVWAQYQAQDPAGAFAAEQAMQIGLFSLLPEMSPEHPGEAPKPPEAAAAAPAEAAPVVAPSPVAATADLVHPTTGAPLSADEQATFVSIQKAANALHDARQRGTLDSISRAEIAVNDRLTQANDAHNFGLTPEQINQMARTGNLDAFTAKPAAAAAGAVPPEATVPPAGTVAPADTTVPPVEPATAPPAEAPPAPVIPPSPVTAEPIDLAQMFPRDETAAGPAATVPEQPPILPTAAADVASPTAVPFQGASPEEVTRYQDLIGRVGNLTDAEMAEGRAISDRMTDAQLQQASRVPPATEPAPQPSLAPVAPLPTPPGLSPEETARLTDLISRPFNTLTPAEVTESSTLSNRMPGEQFHKLWEETKPVRIAAPKAQVGPAQPVPAVVAPPENAPPLGSTESGWETTARKVIQDIATTTAKPIDQLTTSDLLHSRALPPMQRLPDHGQFSAVQTDDGSIYYSPTSGGLHVDIIRSQGIPPERLVSGGWLIDGVYEPSARSDTTRLMEIAQAQLNSTANRLRSHLPEPATLRPTLDQKPPPSTAPHVYGSDATAPGISDPGQQYQFRYKVVSLDDVVASHTDTFAENPSYPQGLQPRLKDRAASKSDVALIASDLQPGALLDEFHALDRGAPIVGPDNLVESGNSRTLALRQVRDAVPKKFQKYQQALRAAVQQVGIDPAQLDGFTDPVLVRERVTPVDRSAFAEEANASSGQEMSPVENARVDAARLDDARLAQLQVGDNQTIEQALQLLDNREFVRSFVASLPKRAQGALLDANGALSPAGVQRIKGAIFARVFPGAAGQRLAQAFIDSLDSGILNVEKGIYKALPKLARAESLIRSGARNVALDIADDTARSLNVLASLKRAGTPVDFFLKQDALFGRELTPFQEKILEHVNTLNRSPNQVASFFKGYADAVEAEPNPQQMTLIPVPERTKQEIVDALIGQQRAEMADLGNGLFAGQPAAEPSAAGQPAAVLEPAASAAARDQLAQPERGGTAADQGAPGRAEAPSVAQAAVGAERVGAAPVDVEQARVDAERLAAQGMDAELARVHAERLQLQDVKKSRPDTVPNLRDYYPDQQKFEAALAAWHQEGAALDARINKLAEQEYALRRSQANRAAAEEPSRVGVAPEDIRKLDRFAKAPVTKLSDAQKRWVVEQHKALPDALKAKAGPDGTVTITQMIKALRKATPGAITPKMGTPEYIAQQRSLVGKRVALYGGEDYVLAVAGEKAGSAEYWVRSVTSDLDPWRVRQHTTPLSLRDVLGDAPPDVMASDAARQAQAQAHARDQWPQAKATPTQPSLSYLHANISPKEAAQSITRIYQEFQKLPWPIKTAAIAGGLMVAGRQIAKQQEQATGTPEPMPTDSEFWNNILTLNGNPISNIAQPRDLMTSLNWYQDHLANPFAEVAAETLELPPAAIAKVLGINPVTAVAPRLLTGIANGFFDTQLDVPLAGLDWNSPASVLNGLNQRYLARQKNAPAASFLWSMAFDPLNWVGWGEGKLAATTAKEALTHTAEATRLLNEFDFLTKGNAHDIGLAMTELMKGAQPARVVEDFKTDVMKLTANGYLRPSVILEDIQTKLTQRVPLDATEARLSMLLGKRPDINSAAVSDLMGRAKVPVEKIAPTADQIKAITQLVLGKGRLGPSEQLKLADILGASIKDMRGKDVAIWVADHGVPDLTKMIDHMERWTPDQLVGYAGKKMRDALPPDRYPWANLMESFPIGRGLMNVGSSLSARLEPVGKQIMPLQLLFLTSPTWPIHAAYETMVRAFRPSWAKTFVTDLATKAPSVAIRGTAGTAKSLALFGPAVLREGLHPAVQKFWRGAPIVARDLPWHFDADANELAYIGLYGPSAVRGRGGYTTFAAGQANNAMDASIVPFVGRTFANAFNKTVLGPLVQDMTPSSPMRKGVEAVMRGFQQANLARVFSIVHQNVAQTERLGRLNFIANEHPMVRADLLKVAGAEVQAAEQTLKNLVQRPDGIPDELWNQIKPLVDAFGGTGRVGMIVDQLMKGQIDRSAFAARLYEIGGVPMTVQAELSARLVAATPERLRAMFQPDGEVEQLFAAGIKAEHGVGTDALVNSVWQGVSQDFDKLSSVMDTMNQQRVALEGQTRRLATTPAERAALDQQIAAINRQIDLAHSDRNVFVRKAWQQVTDKINAQFEIHNRLWDWAYERSAGMLDHQKNQLFAAVRPLRQKLISLQQREYANARAMYWNTLRETHGIPVPPQQVFTMQDEIAARQLAAFEENDRMVTEYWAKPQHDPQEWQQLQEDRTRLWNQYRSWRDLAQGKINEMLQTHFQQIRSGTTAMKRLAAVPSFPVVPAGPEQLKAEADARIALDQMRGEVENFVKKESIQPPVADTVRAWANELDNKVQAIPAETRAAVDNVDQAAARIVTQRLNDHFVNHIDRTALDRTFANFWPFWMYDAHGGRFYGWLMSHVPGAWPTAAGYLQQTHGTGYFPTGVADVQQNGQPAIVPGAPNSISGEQINFLRGLYPERYLVLGQQLARTRPSDLQKILDDPAGIFNTASLQTVARGLESGFGSQGILGAHATPPIEAAALLAQGKSLGETGAAMAPPLAQDVNDLAAIVHGGFLWTDPYKQDYITTELASRGIDPKTATPQQRADAEKAVALRDVPNAVMPRFIYRDPGALAERKDMQTALVAAGVSIKQQKAMQDQGISVWSAGLNAEQKRTLMAQNPQWAYYWQAGDAFKTPEQQQQAADVSRFVNDLHTITTDRQTAQVADDARLALQPTDPKYLSPTQWMKNHTTRAAETRGKNEQEALTPWAQSAKKVLDDPARANILQPEDKAVATYWSNYAQWAKDNTNPDTQQVDWATVQKQEDAYVQSLDPATQKYVQTEIQKNLTPTEKEWQAALRLYDEYRAIPRWIGISPEQATARAKLEATYSGLQKTSPQAAKVFKMQNALLARTLPRNPARAAFIKKNPILTKWFGVKYKGETDLQAVNFGEPLETPWSPVPEGSGAAPAPPGGLPNPGAPPPNLQVPPRPGQGAPQPQPVGTQ